jgi:hypothetical protein
MPSRSKRTVAHTTKLHKRTSDRVIGGPDRTSKCKALHLNYFGDIAALTADALMRIQVDDLKLFFDVEGSKLRPDGPPMRQVPTRLLLHGGPARGSRSTINSAH